MQSPDYPVTTFLNLQMQRDEKHLNSLVIKRSSRISSKTFKIKLIAAFHVFGAPGKLIIEIGMIGFLLGTCIAFFVVMGDLGPEIVAEVTGQPVTSAVRCTVMMALALFCVLPLGLLRNVDSLSGVSKATIAFYCSLILKVYFKFHICMFF